MRRGCRDDAQHRIGRFHPYRPRIAGLDRDAGGGLVDEFFKVRVEVEQRRQRVGDAVDPLRDERDPVDRGDDDDRQRKDGNRQEYQHAQRRCQLGRHAAPFEPFEHWNERDRHHKRGRDRKEELRACPQGERQGQDKADAADQCQ